MTSGSWVGKAGGSSNRSVKPISAGECFDCTPTHQTTQDNVGMHSLYIKKTVHDYEVCLEQQTITRDVVLMFGPLETTLSALVDDGFSLRVVYQLPRPTHHRNKVNLYLVRGTERYKLRRLSLYDVLNTNDLCQFVKNCVLTNNGSTADHKVVHKHINLVEQHKPFETLKRAYPKSKRKMMVGNMTMQEYVLDILNN